VVKFFEMKLSIFCDGGARGNPGPAASAFVAYQNGRTIYRFGKKIGETTNNVAEYQAVIFALEWLKDQSSIVNRQSSIAFFLDSQLVVNQLNGAYKIKNENLKILAIKVKKLEQEISNNISYSFIPRTKNKLADSLVGDVLSS